MIITVREPPYKYYAITVKFTSVAQNNVHRYDKVQLWTR